MQGSILYIDQKQGFIQGSDQNRYFFTEADWRGTNAPVMGQTVTFQTEGQNARDVQPQVAAATVSWGQSQPGPAFQPTTESRQPFTPTSGMMPGGNPAFGSTLSVPVPSKQETSLFFQSFLTFDKMIAPTLITIWYYIVLAVCVLGGGWAFLSGVFGDGYDKWIKVSSGLGILIFGPILARLWAEFIIVIFKIHTRLKSVDEKTKA